MSRIGRHAPVVEVPDEGASVAMMAVSQPPLSGRSRRSRRLRREQAVAVLACVLVIAALVELLRNVGPAGDSSRVGLAAGVLAVVSLVATLGYLVILAALHALPTGYSPIRHAVSDYGVGRFSSLFTVGLYVSSLGVLALAFGLRTGVGTPPLATHEFVFLALIPLARIGMTVFPTTLEGQPITRTGVRHYVCAIAAFTFTYLAISEMTPALRGLLPSEWTRGPLGWTAAMVAPALALVVITMVGPLRKVFGLFERLFLISTNVWFALAAAVLITRLQ